MRARYDARKASVGDNWQLVDVLSAHYLKRLNDRSIRDNCLQLCDGAHRTLYTRLRPACTIDFGYLLWRDQSGYTVVLHDQKAAASRPQHEMVNKVLQAQMAGNRWAVAVHKVGDFPVPESRQEFHLNIACTGSIQQEPTDKGEPQPAKTGSHKKSKQTRQDKQKGDHLAHAGRGSSGASGIAGDPPDYSSQDTAAIEGISGNHVEKSQHDVDVTEPDHNGGDRRRSLGTRQPSREPGSSQKKQTDHDARDWTSNRDPEFRLPIRSSRSDLRYAAKSE